MFELFKLAYPTVKVGYETYRVIFNNNFNIGFGFPRKDTCLACDEFFVNIKHNDQELLNAVDEDIIKLKKIKKDLETEHELHTRKAASFYSRKSDAKNRAKISDTFEAIAFDFQKNLPLLNKSTNDMYYRRQLKFFSFNIHILSSDEAFLYTYDETVGKKGADGVCSMLYHFIINHLSDNVSELHFFCDGCAGQNKNYTVFRFLHWMVHYQKRFRCIKVSFPIRGHSYMECDRDMVNVNIKADVEIPEDWHQVFKNCRKKPSPFNVVNFLNIHFLRFSDFLKQYYKCTCLIKTRPVRELVFQDIHRSLLLYCNNWNGNIENTVLVKRRRKNQKDTALSQYNLYPTVLPINAAKYNDLQVLKRLCKPDNHSVFDNLVTTNTGTPDSESEISDTD
ncbi:uncharacterized protein LOC136087833 [Hydra vulgaris]|uniref:Uncharacterized protein LOC136087833 n=1 Tax=Hydra vulgaris TaxID=6087 RepID=A0ABM4CZT7_HYDVU